MLHYIEYIHSEVIISLRIYSYFTSQSKGTRLYMYDILYYIMSFHIDNNGFCNSSINICSLISFVLSLLAI